MKFTYAITAFATTATAQRWPPAATPVASPLATTTPNPTSNLANPCDYLIFYDGTDDAYGSGGGCVKEGLLTGNVRIGYGKLTSPIMSV
ncbi:hypothetical protein HYALB_00005762 [Hymenoscyphus albidus]|uniref:Uncharacterized protein n=1 Tax=Hymenoscyphus albidus TaxID=595503 RepID=A0A9N9Q6L0_9HELO|nr:hypothetical protein HYALB_00005762 [Hymenoscyphus albidus]